MKIKIMILNALLMLAGYSASGQQVVESIVAVVGNEVIFFSDVEGQVMQMKADRDPTPAE